MDLSTAFQSINWLAILLATVSSFLIGGVWYGPFFGERWMSEMNLTKETLESRNMIKVFGLSTVLTFIATANLAMFIGPEAELLYGTIAGLFAGLGWVSTFVGVLYLFGNKSLQLFLIDAGYCTVTLTIIGLILGAF